MQPVKIGIIGCGLAATNLHWPALQKLPEQFKITMVCDTLEAKAQEFARLSGNVPYVTDPRQVLENPDIEAIDVVLPVNLHYSMARKVLEADKHLFIEKPLAGDLKEARRLRDLEGKYPCVKMVGENFRYRKALVRVKEHLNSGAIGAPLTAICSLLCQFDVPNNPFAQTTWRRQHQFPGGIVTDVGIHWAAQLRFLFGDLHITGAFCQSFDSAIGKLDSISFQFSTPQSLRGVANLFLGAKDYFQDGVTVLGREGTLVGGQHGPNFGDFRISISRGGKTTEEIIEHDTGMQEEFNDFYCAIRTGGQVKSSFKEAYLDLKVILDGLELAKRTQGDTG